MRWLLRRLLSENDRRTIESELSELYELRRRVDGERAARRWLCRQCALFPTHLLIDRARFRIGSVAGRGGLMAGL